MEDFSISAKPKAVPHLIHEAEGPRHLLLHPNRPLWTVVNDAGFEIMKLCDGSVSWGDIARILAERHSLDNDLAISHLRSFFAEVSRTGLLLREETELVPELRTLTSLFIHLTDACNLDCKHCYTYNPKGGGTALHASEVTRLLDELHNLGGREVALSGGEPLLVKDLREVVEHAVRRGLNVRLLTNGTLVDEDAASFFAETGISVQISIDGSCAEVHDRIRGEGSFTKALQGVTLLQQKGMNEDLNLCATIMEPNLDDLPNIMSLTSRLGVPLLRFLPLRRVGQAKKRWKEINVGVDEEGLTGFFESFYFRALKQYPRLRMTSGLSGYVLSAGDARKSLSWCPVGKKLVIGPHGKVYPCVLLMEEPFCLGDIRERSLEAMFRDSRLEELTENIALRRERIETCRRCTWKNFCESGCVGLAVEKEGTLWATDGMCEFRKRLYRESIFGLARGTLGQRTESVKECD